MRRSCTAALLVSFLCSVLLPSAALAGGEGYRFPTRRERFERWAMNALGPSTVAGDFTSAAWGQWVTDQPPQWPDDDEGYVKRLGVAAAGTAITETSLSLLSAAFRQDARYHRCPCRGIGPRLGHALKMTFMARRTDGSAAFSVARVVSPFTGPIVTRTTMYPEGYTLADGAESGAYALLMTAGWNVAREFVMSAPEW